MSIFDKVKNFIDNSDEDTIDENIENVYDDSADDTYASDSTDSAKSSGFRCSLKTVCCVFDAQYSRPALFQPHSGRT